MCKNVFRIGILTVILYFLSVGAFLITQSEMALTVWELMTVISAPVVLLVLLELSDTLSSADICRRAMLAFMSCVCALTGAAHIINIAVTRRLMSECVVVPPYFQIGQWPSVEMAVDYLAWGFFMGLAFLSIRIPVHSEDRSKQRIKMVSLICGILCLLGFAGAILINENIWYVALVGYGLGFSILCIMRLRLPNDR